MKGSGKGDNLKLGAIVVIAIAALIVGLYMIGDKKNLFSKTFMITAEFRDVGGLIAGNNVRFGGIDVGTVEDVQVFSDTSVLVFMRIEEKYHYHIHPNSVASLSTDGVMGNRLVTISSFAPHGEPVADNHMIHSINAVSMDETTRTLSETNKNLKEITDNVKSITAKLDSSALWTVLSDSTVADNIRQSTFDLRQTMDAVSNNFLVKGLQWKQKRKEGKKKEHE